MIVMTKQEVQELERGIHQVLFQEAIQQGLNPMVAIFPTNGLYVASGVVREFNRYNKQSYDMSSYFKNMKMGDYCDFYGLLRVKEEVTSQGVKG